jgi:aspartate kinase
MKVVKFGGSAFTVPSDFKNIASIVEQQNEPVIVVVSAMYQMTDELIGLAEAVCASPPKRELDMLLSVGERVTMSLLAMALTTPAVSFTGSQSGIITTSDHSDALIIDVTPYRILEALKQNKVVIVAGFQGVSQGREITTLGRGGSDTTAVALAVALQADSVVFYKDVPAVYSADPKKDSLAKPLEYLSYSEAASLVSEGHAVIHPRAISLASKNHLPLSVRSFKRGLSDTCEGTLIGETYRQIVPPIYEEAHANDRGNKLRDFSETVDPRRG